MNKAKFEVLQKWQRLADSLGLCVAFSDDLPDRHDTFTVFIAPHGRGKVTQMEWVTVDGLEAMPVPAIRDMMKELIDTGKKLETDPAAVLFKALSALK